MAEIVAYRSRALRKFFTEIFEARKKVVGETPLPRFTRTENNIINMERWREKCTK